MSLYRMPSVGKSLISRIFARSSEMSIASAKLTMHPTRRNPKKPQDLGEAGRTLLEVGPHGLARLIGGIRPREGVDAGLDGGAADPYCATG